MSKLVHRLTRPTTLFIRAIAATYRLEVLHPEIRDSVFERGEVPIYCSWHQRWFAGFARMSRRRPMAVMVSQSGDGEFISKIASVLGCQIVRGSSSKGGVKAFRELIGFLKRGVAVGHVVDGPRGPFGVIKPGLMSLAQISGMPIVPMIISPERKWIFNSWDRFMLPKPFSRICVRFDREVYVPRRLSHEKVDEMRKHMELKLHALYEETDRSWSKKA